jgi:hypothetical protein
MEETRKRRERKEERREDRCKRPAEDTRTTHGTKTNTSGEWLVLAV